MNKECEGPARGSRGGERYHLKKLPKIAPSGVRTRDTKARGSKKYPADLNQGLANRLRAVSKQSYGEYTTWNTVRAIIMGAAHPQKKKKSDLSLAVV